MEKKQQCYHSSNLTFLQERNFVRHCILCLVRRCTSVCIMLNYKIILWKLPLQHLKAPLISRSKNMTLNFCFVTTSHYCWTQILDIWQQLLHSLMCQSNTGNENLNLYIYVYEENFLNNASVLNITTIHSQSVNQAGR